ncbi:MAG: hypothetical protein U1F68_20920 [Gammaproteobacteria bacterium]
MDSAPVPPQAVALWSNTARPIRFFLLDGRAALCLLIFFVHIAVWTAVVAAVLSTLWPGA